MYFFSFISLLATIYFIDNSDGENGSNILNKQGVIAVAIALSMAFGFFLLVILLGYALVRIPILTWINSNNEESLNRHLF